MLTASTVEDKALISGEEMSPFRAKDVQCLLFHWRMGVTTKMVNSLTLSSMMQDCYRYFTACTWRANSCPPTISTRRHCWLFWMLSQSSGEWDHGLALSSTRTAVLLLQHIYTHVVWHHSQSQPWRQLTSQFWSGSANQFSHESGQTVLKPVRLQIGP